MLILIYIIVLFTSYDDNSWDTYCENANSRNSLFEINRIFLSNCVGWCNTLTDQLEVGG